MTSDRAGAQPGPTHDDIWHSLGELLANPGNIALLWRHRRMWQIAIRWTMTPLVLLGLLVGVWLGFDLDVLPILAIAASIALYNAVFAWVLIRYRGRLRSDRRLERRFTVLEVVCDYAAVFLLIHFTGGAWSPLVPFLIFHVIIGAIQFSPAVAHLFAVWAAAGMWLMLLAQVRGWLVPSVVGYHGQPLHPEEGPVSAAVMLAFYTATLFLTAAMVGQIMGRVSDRVDELARTASELSEANEAIERLMQERTQFMLEVAHNLRAPLGASLGMVELIRDGTLGDVNDRQADYLERTDTRLRSLHRMIGELLTIGRAADWTREIPDVLVDLGDLVRYTERTFRDEAAAKGVRFAVEAGPDLPTMASGSDLLEQLVENLVSNAIKYTPEGGEVEFRVALRGPDTVRIVVRDTGIGIPEAEQGKLFQEFFRASNARQHTAEGTGLGMVLVRRTVERHLGSMTVDSAEGRGTTVTIDLPVRRPAPL